jgi:hypothetical protein
MGITIERAKQVQIISALVEGCSIRSVERMTGIHRDTIMRLGARVGEGCAVLMDEMMRDLPCERLELDELWAFVGKKQRHVTATDDASKGDTWTWVAIDATTKLVPTFFVGKRDAECDHGSGWLLYLPGQTPCLCDDFDGAAEMMRKWLARRRR